MNNTHSLTYNLKSTTHTVTECFAFSKPSTVKSFIVIFAVHFGKVAYTGISTPLDKKKQGSVKNGAENE